MKQAVLTLLVIAVILLIACSKHTQKDENLLDTHEKVSIPVVTHITTETSYDNNSDNNYYNTETIPFSDTSSHKINIQCISQNPELPTGCEITSLAMVLNYYGYDVSKLDLARNYLIKDYSGKVPFDVAFMGNPETEDGYGCFAPVIVNSALKYLNEHDGKYSAWDISGRDLSELYEKIDQDKPVIVWVSMNLIDLEKKFIIRTAEGRDVYWYDNEHCVVLCGYDKSDNTVIAADPLAEMLMKYDAQRFELIYNQLGKQAVLIE